MVEVPVKGCWGKGKTAGPKGPSAQTLDQKPNVGATKENGTTETNNNSQQQDKDKQLETAFRAIIKLLGGVPLTTELEAFKDGMEQFLVKQNPQAAQKASIAKLAAFQAERELADGQLNKLRKLAVQKKKEYQNIMRKAATLEGNRGNLTDQIRTARQEVGQVDSEPDGDQMDTHELRAGEAESSESEELEGGSEGEGMGGSTLAKATSVLKKSYGDLYGPSRARRTRKGPYVDGDTEGVKEAVDDIL